MSDFPEIYFGEVVEFFKNGTTATQVPVKTSKAVTRIETISNGKIDQNKLGYVSNNEDVERYRLNEGDILFSHINSIKHIGKTALVPEVDELFNGMNLLQIRPNREITDPKFLHELLNSETIRRVFRRIAKQAVNQASISISQLQGISFSLPPLSKQRKIAEIISGIDKSLNGIISEKIYIEQIMRALIQQLTRGLHHTGKRKNSGTEFGLIPSDWNCELVPECCKLENKKRKPIKADDRKKMRGKYPYHGATKIQDYISEYSFEGEYTLIGEDGDHFIKYDSWNMAQYATGRFNVSNHAHVIGSTSKCNSKWLYYSMLHRDLTLYLTRQGATRFKLSKASLEEVPVLFPPMKEQLKMISIFDTFSKLINALDEKIIKLSALKKGISSDLFSGCKRVSV